MVALKKDVLIKKALLDHGIKQVEIASALGVTRAAISMFISGKASSRRFDAWVKLNLGV